eukprot:CAMPEP_0177617448 /NCGR_PEP_ID=MMETSP0419_2-20121207/24883_1 /TAXON_ID=582737 /ORGANISM="Tetraselmis sp., Strain GSL018" /LENGTH=97 /DNA_ID=CAMNT_0019115951 /DNA_START=310 /DNA_END=603 /DNA_ORIENTATION=-
MALSGSMQSLTGAAGVMVETHCKESWAQVLVRQWGALPQNKLILAAIFTALVCIISFFSYLDEEDSLESRIDPGAGVMDQQPGNGTGGWEEAFEDIY